MTVLWKEILAQSSLAASMRDVYQAVSQNKIAVLQLTTAEGTVAHSVQIPIPFFVEDLPTEGDDTSRGLWLTTANAMDEEDEPPDDSTLMDKNFALLLLDSEKKIISELEADPDETSQAMIEFVRTSRPTMSIYQVSENSSLSLHQVRRYAQHFIFWRRAIAIPPLHARDVYIVSPNCDLSQLPRASLEWQRNFPYAPPLADFLGELSAAPRPYKTFCPSKAFRPFYLHMLAYLMRNGWVTQLCTFAYVIVWPEIVYEVDYAEEGEAIRAAQEAAAARAAAAQAQAQAQAQVQQQQHHRRQQSHRSSYDSYDESDASEGGVVSDSDSAALLSSSGSSDATRRPSNPTVLAISPTALGFPSLHSSGPASPSSSTHGTTTNTGAVPVTPAVAAAERARLTRIAERSRAELAERVAAHARRPKPTPTDRPSTNPAPHLRRVPPHIIKDAGRASGREARYLEVIGARLAAAAERAREKEEREKAAALAEQERVRERAARERERERNQLSGRPPPPPPPSQTRTRGGNIGKEKGEEKGKESAAADGKGASSGLGQNQQQPPITADDRARAAQLWPSFWRYFNGRTALERVALQEDMKRKEAWQVLSAMSEYLLCVRHW